MKIVVQLPEHAAAVRAFNERLAAKGATYSFPLLPPTVQADGSLGSTNYLAMDGDEVRGGYTLIRHESLVTEVLQPVQFLQIPLSEGIVDPKFRMVGALLLKDALKKSPLLFGLGMGGIEQPLPRLLKALGFKLHSVPFYFRVFRPARFFRSIVPLRSTPLRRTAFDFLAATHILDLPVLMVHAAKAAGAPGRGGVETAIVNEFEGWADTVWEAARHRYSMVAERYAAALNLRYPQSAERLIRLRIRRRGADIGWAVVMDSQFQDHKYFGRMRVGTFVDALALPGEEALVVREAVAFLRGRSADLMISNQCAEVWGSALQNNGFLAAASNFGFAASPKLFALLAETDPSFARAHLCRGDGDGPIHL